MAIDEKKRFDAKHIHENTDATLVCTVYDDHDTANANKVDITSFTITVTLYEGKKNATKIFTKDTSGDVTITDATGGVFEVDIKPADTDGKRGYRWLEFEATDTGSNDVFMGDGFLEIRKNKS